MHLNEAQSNSPSKSPLVGNDSAKVLPLGRFGIVKPLKVRSGNVNASLSHSIILSSGEYFLNNSSNENDCALGSEKDVATPNAMARCGRKRLTEE